MGLERMTSNYSITWIYTNQTTRWLVHSLGIFGARMNHGQFRLTRLTTARTWGSHHLPPYNIISSSPWGPHPNGILSRDSQVGVPKFSQLGLPQLGLPQLWGPITLRADLQLQWGLKQSYSLHWEISNDISHATYTRRNRVDSWLLVVRSQTVNLTPSISFDHNLCFICPNGSCKPTLDIFIQ
jgi:hypothetical protein